MSRILKHIKIFVAVFIMLAGVFICACSSPSLGVDGRISVTVEDSPYYTAENSSFRVESGESVSIALTFEDDCAFGGCSYDGYDLRQEGESTVLTLRNVIRPTRVKIEVLFSAATICYDGNGALFENEKSALLVGYDLSRHLRANTETIILLRDGYLHVGWNTKPDGSGEHIGLGSRITVTSGTAVTLYASWKKQNDASDFIYRVSSDTAVLEKYTGSAEADEIVIPREIDGLKVTGIAKGFAQRLKAKVLALPDTIVEVENGAFRDCDIEEIIFWDGVERISDSAFLGGKFKTWRLNAKLKPRYLASSEHVQFAENIDKLILLEDKRKLVFFGGCSMSYGLSSELIDEQFGSRFTVLNLGVIGGVDAGFQFDCISNYLSDGDILVHAPEVGSVFQFMGVRFADPRIFMMAEGNFDLLALADMSCLPNAFATLAEFNAGRRNLPAGEYSDCTEVYNIYGDIIKPRPFTGEKYGDGSDSYGYSPECADSLGNLCDEYDAMREKGVEVYFSYSPVNLDGISERKRQELVWMDFEQKCDKALSERGYTVISSARDYLYSGEYFYDRDYHLNDKGAIIRTNQLIDDLKKVIAT